MKRIVAVFVVVFAIMAAALSAFALSLIVQEIQLLKESGKQSSDVLNHAIINLAAVDTGTVVSYVYTGNAEDLTVNTHAVLPQAFYPTSTDKLTRFMFELTNRYRPETDIALSIDRDNMTVHAYTYGTYKYEAMLAIISGIPDCLDSAPYRRDDDDSGWIDKYGPEEMTKTTITTFSLGSESYTVDDELMAMDVAPDIVDNRVIAPVRFVAYASGVEPGGVEWDHESKQVTLKSGDTDVTLAIGSATMNVNGEAVAMDVAPYIKDGRIMLHPRWVAEAFGATVHFDEGTKEITISVETTP